MKCGPATARASYVMKHEMCNQPGLRQYPTSGLCGSCGTSAQDMLPGDIVCDLVRLSVPDILRWRCLRT